MGRRERAAASAAAAVGVAILMMVAGCGGGGGPAAGARSATAGSTTGPSGDPTAAAVTSAAGSTGVASAASGTAAAGGGGNGSVVGGAPVGLLPSAGMTGAVGTAISAGCKNADNAWSAFRSAYAAATSNPDKSAAAATAASTYAQVVQNVTQAVDPNDTSVAYRARGQDVVRHATTVLNDLKSLARDLEAGDTNAAAMLYSSSNPLSPVQLDEAAFQSDCGN